MSKADLAASMPRALEALSFQPRVQSFFASALKGTTLNEQRLSHAYLFVGMDQQDMLRAARAIGCCVVCPNGGDATCDECIVAAR